MTEDKTPSWELRRPDLVLAEIARGHPFDRPRTLLARIEGPYDGQHVVDSTVLWEEPPADEIERTRETERALQRLECGFRAGRHRTWPVIVPVVVRPGPSWFSWDESEVLLGLRYGTNMCDVLEGDPLTVTARGWVSWPDGVYGTEPRAQWAVDAVPVT
jgi:hypothetical protein